jgi:RimJ/RimL family protein N-acetyltransferase
VSDFTIKYAEQEDAEKITELIKDCGLYVEGASNASLISERIACLPYSVLIAMDGEEIIGTVFLVMDPWVSVLYHLCVKKEYRGKGVATLLCHKAEEKCKEFGTNSIVGYVDHVNIASRTLAKGLDYKEWPHPLICIFKNIIKEK